MSTRIGLISDIHATPAPVEEAIRLFKDLRVDHILCAGDIAGYGDELDATIELLIEAQCISILGNHDQWFLEKNPDTRQNIAADYFSRLSTIAEMHLEHKKLYMVHASPLNSQLNGMRLLDEFADKIDSEFDYWNRYLSEFDRDVLIVGHTHQTWAERLGNTLVINPGSTKFNHACAILSLPDLSVEFFPLSGNTIQPVWNWRDFIIQDD